MRLRDIISWVVEERGTIQADEMFDIARRIG